MTSHKLWLHKRPKLKHLMKILQRMELSTHVFLTLAQDGDGEREKERKKERRKERERQKEKRKEEEETGQTPQVVYMQL